MITKKEAIFRLLLGLLTKAPVQYPPGDEKGEN